MVQQPLRRQYRYFPNNLGKKTKETTEQAPKSEKVQKKLADRQKDRVIDAKVAE